MIEVLIPDNNVLERKYILETMLKDFLGLKYKVYVKKIQNYELKIANKNLIINDGFFKNFENDLDYLNVRNIPTNVKKMSHELFPEDDLPILYGQDVMLVQDNTIYCGVDIFASSYFMLTRWEEYVRHERDEHQRFPTDKCLAYQYDFTERAIVNEYTEVLWNCLSLLDNKLQRKEKFFKVLLTHDVDYHLKYKNISVIIKEFFVDIFKRRDIPLAFFHIVNFFKVKTGMMKDPFDTFDELMDISESLGTNSYFFFMPTGSTNYDNYYALSDKKVQNLKKKIVSRGHYIGIHPTYLSFDSKERFHNEKNELNKSFLMNVKYVRQHYLRFNIPITWQILEENNMEWDSTLGYYDIVGFRAGICDTYNAFNVITQTKLHLKEKPLIIMDVALLKSSSKYPKSIIEEKVLLLLKRIKRYNGEVVLLVHNNRFPSEEWNIIQKLLHKI